MQKEAPSESMKHVRKNAQTVTHRNSTYSFMHKLFSSTNLKIQQQVSKSIERRSTSHIHIYIYISNISTSSQDSLRKPYT